MMKLIKHPYFYARLASGIAISYILDALTTTYYKIMLKRFKAKYGRGLTIKFGTKMDLFDGCQINISDQNILHGHFRIMGCLSIGKNNLFKKHNRITVSPGGQLRIGDNNLLGGIECNTTGKISIGDFNLFSEEILFFDNNSHSVDHEERGKALAKLPDGLGSETVKKGQVIIGNHNFIGRRAIFLKKTKLGSRCIVGTAAIVNNSVSDNSLLINPLAKVVR